MINKGNQALVPEITTEEKLNILLQFADRDNIAIKDLLIKVRHGEFSTHQKTDENGKISAISTKKNADLFIEVQRKDETFKAIARINTGQTSREIRLISPTRKFEATTKISSGAPGQLIPKRAIQNEDFKRSGRDQKGSPVVAISKKSGEKSGIQWVNLFLPSNETRDLKSPFRENVDEFIAAICQSGAKVIINTTLRPPQRSYLMFYAREIAAGRISPDKVPPFVPRNNDAIVNIDWAHRDASGKPDLINAISAARQMDAKYGAAGIIGKPYRSNHNGGKAIDMKIVPSWAIGKSIPNPQGELKKIVSKKDIVELGASYNVLHWTFSGPRAKSDDPHWSETGN